MAHAVSFPDLLSTKEAAAPLKRKPQTLRLWAIQPDKSPIQPVRIHGRLYWKAEDIARLLEGEKEVA